DLYVEAVDDKRGFSTPASYELQSDTWKAWYDDIVEKLSLNDRFVYKYELSPAKPKKIKPITTYVCEDTGTKFKISAKIAKMIEDGLYVKEIRSPYTGGFA